jgi:hypothetical protein
MVEMLELGILWDQFSIVSDVIVSCILPFIPSMLRLMNHSQPFTNDFPRADIHELIAPDLLHQLIKGTFKDHLVTWVEEYLVHTHGRARADKILDDIDHR